ncbi:MAG: hypothetical protein LH628_17375 [Microcoleus sp. CAN_BIN18]|nr:hypothetical protein [Microcoleus sp. CAN_BIN18]
MGTSAILHYLSQTMQQPIALPQLSQFERPDCPNIFESLLYLGFEPVRRRKPNFSGTTANAAPPSTEL